MSPVTRRDAYTNTPPSIDPHQRQRAMDACLGAFILQTGANGPVRRIAWCTHLVPGAIVVIQQTIIATITGTTCHLMSPTPAIAQIDTRPNFLIPNHIYAIPITTPRPQLTITIPALGCDAPWWPEQLLATLICDTSATNVHHRRGGPHGWCEIAASYYEHWLCMGCGTTFENLHDLKTHQNVTPSLLPDDNWSRLIQENIPRPQPSFPCHNHGTVASDGGLNDYLHQQLRIARLAAIQQGTHAQQNPPAQDGTCRRR